MSSRTAVRALAAAGLAASLLVVGAGASSAGSTWGAPHAFSPMAGDAALDPAAARVVMSEDGQRAVALWEDPAAQSIQVASWTAASGWSAQEGFAGTSAELAVSDDARDAVVSFARLDNSDGTNHVLLKTWDGSAWSPEADLVGDNAYPGPVTISGDGSVAFIAYYDGTDVLHLDRWTSSGGPVAAAVPPVAPVRGAFRLSANGGTALAVGLDNATDPARNAVVATWFSGSSWSDPVALSPAGQDGQQPEVALSADGGTALVVWTRYSFDDDPAVPQDAMAARWSSSTWAAAQKISDAGHGRLAASADASVAAYVAESADGLAVTTMSAATWTSAGTITGTDGSDVTPRPAVSRDGSALAVGWDAATPAGYTVARWISGQWVPSVLESAAADPWPSLSLSGDGTRAITAWQSTACDVDSVCVNASVLGPVQVARTSGPTVTGTVRVGSTLTCAVTYTGAETVSYSWKRNGATIAGAGARTRTLVPADLGTRITCASGATGGGRTLAPATSPSTVVVAAGPAPRATTRPSVRGTKLVGRTLTAKHGTWSPAATSYRYQWLRDGKVIKGATSSRYKLPARAKGHRISVRVTARATGYLPGTATSTSVRIR
jgi:hypothetical protein